jgi:predicted transcriptional regulator
MAGRKQLAITERQFAVLDLLWTHGPLTVREMLGRLPGGGKLPYTTVLGLLQGMERAELVTHGAEQPAHRYRPALTRDAATRTLLGDFLRRFFRGSAKRLVLGLVDTQHITPDELRDIEGKCKDALRPREKPPTRRKKP